MNRREFCQTAALFCAGSLCAGTVLQGEERIHRFRAQKIFLESWQDTACSASFVQEKLESISGNGCNGLLLIPDRRSLPRWEKMIKAEGDRLGLIVFVPTRLTSPFLQKIRTVTPLVYESGIFQGTDKKSADDGGFLLSDKADHVLGLVQYDLSRCRWSEFAPLNIETVRDAVSDVNGSRLVAARWIDQAEHFFCG